MSFKLKGLTEQRAAVKAKIESLRDRVLIKEQRALNSDEKAEFDKLAAEFTKIGEAYTAAQSQMQAFDALVNAAPPDGEGDPAPADPPPQMNSRRPDGHARNHDPRRPTPGDGAATSQRTADRRLAFRAWCRRQHAKPLTAEQREACKRTGLNPSAKHFEFRISTPGKNVKRRAMTAAANPTVAEEFSYALESALASFSNVRGVVDEFSTDTGADMPYPKEDDTGNTGEQIGESAEVAFTDPTLSSVTFGAYKFSSKGILVPQELLDDSAFDLETFLGDQIGTRIGRIQGSKFTTGSGTSTPMGIVTASTLGVTAASATAFTAPELTRLAFAVDPSYRTDPSCAYMMHDTTLAYALLLVDGQSRPLLRESYRDGIVVPTLNGFPVYGNQFMSQCSGVGGIPVTASKHVLFGALGKFKVRDVGAVRVRRLSERYAEKDQVGFIGFMRSDSRCVNTAAIKHLLQA